MSCPEDVNYSLVQTVLRAPAEGAGAMFKQFKALRHISLDPSVITDPVISAAHRGTWRGDLPVVPGRFWVARRQSQRLVVHPTRKGTVPGGLDPRA